MAYPCLRSAICCGIDARMIRIPFLLPGTYRLTAEMAGFKTYAQESVPLRVADSLDLTVRLEIGATTETVEDKKTPEDVGDLWYFLAALADKLVSVGPPPSPDIVAAPSSATTSALPPGSVRCNNADAPAEGENAAHTL